MKLFKNILSVILVLMLSNILNIYVLAEETSGSTAEDADTEIQEATTYEINVSPHNYANVLLNTSATYHNSKDKISTAAQYAYVNNSTISKTMRAYTFVTEFKIPLKSALSSMLYNASLYREGNTSSTISIKYINSEIKTDNPEDMPTFEKGVYQGSYTKTVDTGETDESGNAITTTEEVISETDIEYKKWYNYAKQFWTSSLPTAGSVNKSGVFSLDFSETVLPSLKTSEADYITFGTARTTNSYSRYFYNALPSLTLTYNISDILAYVNSATADNIEEVIKNSGLLGILDSESTTYEAYEALDADFKPVVNKNMLDLISEAGVTSLSEVASLFNSAMDIDNIMLGYLNSATEENISIVMEKLGSSGVFDASSSGYEAYELSSDAVKAEINKNMLSLIPQDGFLTLSEVCTAFDSAMNIDTVSVTINPSNHAVVLLNTEATYHNSSDKVSVETQHAHVNNLSLTSNNLRGYAMRAYTFITEFNIPIKEGLRGITFDGGLYREGNVESTVDIKYITSEIKTDSEDTMPTLTPGTYQGSYTTTVDTGETDENGNAITKTEEVISETDAEYKKWYNYAKQFWTSSLPTAASVNKSNDFNLDISDTAMTALKKSDSDYLTFGTSRVGYYSRYFFQCVPKLTLTYAEADLIEYVKSATEETIAEKIEILGETGLLDKSKNKYKKFLGFDDTRKEFVLDILSDLISKSNYTAYSEFLDDYDKAIKAPTETTLYDIEITDTVSGTKYSDMTDALGKTVNIKTPVTFVNEEYDSFTGILSLYDGSGKLLNAKTKAVASSDTNIEFEVTIPADTFEAKVMLWNSLENMVPLCEESIKTTGMVDYNLMTFNIRYPAVEDTGVKAWDNRKEAVVSYLNSSDAAVICMQEVRPVQYTYIRENIDSKYALVYYEEGAGPCIAYDTTIFEKASESLFWLSETPEVPSYGWGAGSIRPCINVLLKDKEKGGMINVFDVHLDNGSKEAREKGLELIMSKINAADYPTFAAGDFNTKSTSDCYKTIAEVMQDCGVYAPETDEGITYHNWGSISDYSSTPIDFCFVSKEKIEPLTFKICRDKWDEVNYYSDHYALKTKVKVSYAFDEIN